MNKKRTIIVVAVIVVLAVVAGLIYTQRDTSSPSGKVTVSTSFYPLYYFASQIGGNKAEVSNITPAGAEPHEYEPTAQDIVAIDESKILVLNGGGLEAWADNVKANLDPNKTTVVTAGEGLTNQQFEEEGENITDPHIWLSPVLAQQMVDKITAGFVKVDASNATYYQNNADALKQKLQDLDTEYKGGLASCQSKDIITSHAAFGYLATTYGLNQISITGLSPEEEPSQQTLSEIADFARKNNIQYIFFESLVSPKLSETVANEIGAKTLVLDPLEGISNEGLAAGENYFTVMQQNLQNLETALGCSK